VNTDTATLENWEHVRLARTSCCYTKRNVCICIAGKLLWGDNGCCTVDWPRCLLKWAMKVKKIEIEIHIAAAAHK
jgi:hypothetical protein